MFCFGCDDFDDWEAIFPLLFSNYLFYRCAFIEHFVTCVISDETVWKCAACGQQTMFSARIVRHSVAVYERSVFFPESFSINPPANGLNFPKFPPFWNT